MRSRLAIWNFATNLLFTAVTLVVGLWATPHLLEWLGEERFGAYRMLTQWLGYLTLLDLGLTSALVPFVARGVARDDRQEIRATIAAGARAYLRVSASALAAGLVLAVFIPRLVPVQPALRTELRIAWVIGLAAFLPLCLSPFRALAEVRQRGFLVNAALIMQSLLVTGLSLFLAYSGWGIVGQSLAVALGTLPFVAFMVLDGRRRYPGLVSSVWSARPGPEVRRAIRSMSFSTFAMNLSGRISVLTDEIVAGFILGPVMVPILFATQRLATLTMQVLQGLGVASWAGLAELYNHGELGQFNRRLIELNRLTTFLGVAALGPIVAFNRHFVGLWMGPEMFGGDAISIVASADALLMAWIALWCYCFHGTGKVGHLVPVSLVSAVLNLELSIILTGQLGRIAPTMGLVGPLLGTLVSFALTRVWYIPLLLRRVFGTPLRALFASTVVPLAWGVPYTAALWWVAGRQESLGWILLGVEMSAAALGFLALGAFVILKPEERDAWRGRLSDTSQSLWRRLRGRGARTESTASPDLAGAVARVEPGVVEES